MLNFKEEELDFCACYAEAEYPITERLFGAAVSFAFWYKTRFFLFFFFVKEVETCGDLKPFAPARASLVIKRSMSHPDCSGMLEKELGDPYVPPRMPQLSGLFRSHPNQCVSLEPAASGEQVHKSQPSYLLGSAAGSCRDSPAPQM